MNWFEGKDHCKREGGNLVEIDSKEENTALIEEIKGKGFSDKLFWMGMTDRGSEGEWGKSPQNGTERVSVTSAKTFFFS